MMAVRNVLQEGVMQCVTSASGRALTMNVMAVHA